MHHSLDICYDIAEKLKNPEKISQILRKMNESSSHWGNGWPELSLVRGIPGIVCFYAMMNLNFRNEGWDRVAHSYLKQIKTHLETVDYLSASLFYGLAGLSFSIHLCSDNRKYYAKMLSKLDDLFIQDVRERFLNAFNDYLDPHTPVPSNFYDLANGLSGVISYLLHRDDLSELTIECVNCLLQLLSKQKIIDSHSVFPWLTIPENSDYEINRAYKKGFYRLEVPYGIPGVLGTFSQVMMKGVKVPGLHEWIETTSEWIQSKQKIHNELVHWNRMVSHEESLEEPVVIEKHGNNWLAGTPGVSRCLYLASKALNNQKLATYSENAFLAHLRSFPDHHKTADTSFSLGKAGLLSLTYHMGCDTEKPLFFKIAKEIEENLKRCYNPCYPFGFQSIRFHPNGDSEWNDIPTLYNGACGIGLSLLEVQGRVKMPWNQIFLIF